MIRQIRVYSLHIPQPGIRPLILAAVPISSKLKRDNLFEYMLAVLDGLISRGISIASFSCDGSDLERSVQHLFTETCAKLPDGLQTHSFPHPDGQSPPVEINIPVYRGTPIVMLQDSKHMAKTMRNNAFSGARTLVTGNHITLFQDLAKLCTDTDGPMYKRDFFKLDRQDDNAALRLLSSGSLKHLTEKHPELMGPIVYLFVCGELVDAYQNRKIGHDERVGMALRAKFFFETWEHTLEVSGHPIDTHGVSRQARDILRIACDGLVGLVCSYRDHGDIEPLLPWLHSTEICEHIFAELRKIIKDFTALDFIYLVAGVEAMLRASMDSSDPINARARAEGYAHTWCEQRGIDLAVLSDFPSHDRIVEAARVAYVESTSLWNALGVCVDDILAARAGRCSTTVRLPAFRVAFPDDLSDDDEDDATVDETELLHELVSGQDAMGGVDTDGRLLGVAAATLLAHERVEV
jgi:hypothetical protein